MWVHYASDYTGICVGYSPERLLGSLPDGVNVVRLAYGGGPPIIGKGETTTPQGAAMKILSHKKDSWAYEREWLLLGPLGRVDLSGKDCVTEVYLGSRIEPHHRTQIRRKLANEKIKIWNMKVSGYSHEFSVASA